MGKKRSRKSYKSLGMYSNVSKATLNMVSRTVAEGDKLLNKIKAWRAGKNPWIAVENKGLKTNQKFTKVRANELYGNPKNATYGIYRGKGAE